MHLATDMHGSFGGGDTSSTLPDEVEVTIGILGEYYCRTISRLDRSKLPISLIALQGAFIEHEHALQRLFIAPSFLRQRKGINWTFSTVQVRSTEDLERCSALIIPGGGESRDGFRSAIECSQQRNYRIHDNCAVVAPFIAPRTPARVLYHEADMGDVCWRDTAGEGDSEP